LFLERHNALLALAMLGAFYGLETSVSTLGALVTVPLYGFVSAVIGAPLAFALNITRYWRYPLR
jgi:hypothetical protein